MGSDIAGVVLAHGDDACPALWYLRSAGSGLLFFGAIAAIRVIPGTLGLVEALYVFLCDLLLAFHARRFRVRVLEGICLVY